MFPNWQSLKHFFCILRKSSKFRDREKFKERSEGIELTSMKVEALHSMLSLVPIREKMASQIWNLAKAAGTKQPICAMTWGQC
jgi:hypothetical protein